jgi:hypothetical protein
MKKRKGRYPRGHVNKWNPGQTRISISFTHQTFKRLLARAKAEKKMFSEIVEDVAKCGLLCLEESDAFEIDTRRDTIGDPGTGSTQESDEPMH